MERSSGKVILLGEHAVVYGVPAIVAGIELGATAEATASAAGATATIRLGTHASAAASDGTELGRAFSALLDAASAPPCDVSVTLDLPAGVGLGASAAIAVAVARAVLALAPGGGGPDIARVVDAAMAWERVFHGNPSGVDAWASAHGGCVKFVREKGVERLHVARDLPLAIGIAGPPASTKAMVEGLARLRGRKPEMVQKSFDGIASLVRNAALCIAAGDLPGLGKLLDLNQMLLSGLFLSTEEIERACGIARDAGALGAKLTGSGGGGCVVALCDGDATGVLAAWRGQGIDGFGTVVRASPESAP